MITIHDLSKGNSLLNQFVAEIRDTTVQKDRLRFRRNIERVGEVLAYEISKTLKYTPVEIRTPLGVKICNVPDEQIVLGTILRAGLPLHQGFLQFFDQAENAFVSAARIYNDDHSSFHIHTGYLSAPSLEGKVLMLIDPMLATASSLELAYLELLRNGTPKRIHLACVIASEEGIRNACRFLPEEKTTIWAASVDPELNSQAYIVPGLGDAGDLAYGEKL